MIAILLVSQPLEHLLQALRLPGALSGIVTAELGTEATSGQVLPQDFLNELLILIWPGLPRELLQEVVLALDVRAITKLWLS